MNQKTETNRLYYYCNLSTAIEHILPNRQLLINRVGNTNDPRENKSFVFARAHMDDDDLLKHSNDDISEEIRTDCRMLCFSTDNIHFFGYEYSRMWALYGGNHTGLCIEINKEKFITENQTKIVTHLFKQIGYDEFDIKKQLDHKIIDYDRIREMGMEEYLRDELRHHHIDYFFFTKNKEWESEHEYRLIYFSNSTENEYATINNCIENVFLGIDFDENYLPVVLDKISDINAYILGYTGVRLVPSKQCN